jgi:RNA polymerase sigma-70 factor (ECF subfamily)
MDPESLQSHLSHITTLWTLVREAHHGAPQEVTTAQRLLLERYSGAIHRYLQGALRNAEAADDLFQEFCLRFLRGDFRRASPERGRFRDYVKTALFHLVVNHQKRQRPSGPPDVPEPAWTPPELTEAEQAFLESWREELLDRAWAGLAEIERRSGQPDHSVLRLRTDEPLLSSAALAEKLGTRLGKSYTINAVRQALHRAREKFTDLLLHEVAVSLEEPSPDALEQELLDLGLLDYCRGALQRRRDRP